MCRAGTASLQKGMNFRLRPNCSLILMSRRLNAPYRDPVEENGRVLIYEGHDVSKTTENPNPKNLGQPFKSRRFRRHGWFQTGNWLGYYGVVENTIYIRGIRPARIP